MYTVITKGNNVSKHNSIDSIERSVEGPFLAIDNGNGSKVAFTEDNPITWPDSATNGMQAIVDVKAGTLRFGYFDGWPRAHTEFVVSNYSEQFVSVEDNDPAHVLDLIKEWPSAANSPAALPDLPGFKWMFHEGKCWSICGMNGDTELFEGHWLNYHENKKKYAAPVTGTKHDRGKPILGAVPPHAELAVGRVLTFGAEKYARGNWDKVEDHENRYMDAALRHLNAHRRGELTDSESGESHLAHAACCILFMLDKQERS